MLGAALNQNVISVSCSIYIRLSLPAVRGAEPILRHHQEELSNQRRASGAEAALNLCHSHRRPAASLPWQVAHIRHQEVE